MSVSCCRAAPKGLPTLHGSPAFTLASQGYKRKGLSCGNHTTARTEEHLRGAERRAWIPGRLGTRTEGAVSTVLPALTAPFADRI